MNTNHKLSAIRQIAITISNVSQALPFYRDVLGLDFLVIRHGSAGGLGRFAGFGANR
jgi:catechol 2,3-dioxygenase-like lactoylglutathione lyase family enzyme